MVMAHRESLMASHQRSSPRYCSSFITTSMATSLLLMSHSAYAKVRLEPKLGLRQVFSDNIAAATAGRKDAGMLTVIEPGLGITIDSGRTQATLDYRLEFRQPIFAKAPGDKVRHNLAARGETEVIDDFFWMTGGALVTQIFRDRQGSITLNPDTLSNNLDNVASGYIEPLVRRRINDFVNLGAGLRYNITEVKDRPDNKLLLNDLNSNFSPENFAFQPISDSDSQNAYVQLDAGDYFQNFKWTVRGSYDREKRKYLNELYTSKNVIADVEIPINRAISLLGSAGWEDAKDIQDVIITDCQGRPSFIDPVTNLDTTDTVRGVLKINRSSEARNGIPISGKTFFPNACDGRSVQLSGVIFNRKGFIWDAGFRLSPGRKMDLVVRGGGRFGDVNINATGSYAFSEKTLLDVSYTTSLDSLGRLLSSSLAGTPTRYRSVGNSVRPTLVPQFGSDKLTGQIFTGTLAINSATYLSRTARIRFQHERGPWSGSLALVREERTLQSVQQLPGQTPFDINELPDDVTTGGNFSLEREMSRKRSVYLEASVQNSKFALSDGRNDWLYGGAVGYRVEFTPKIRGEARYLFSRRASSLASSNLTENAISIGIEARF
jgi:hypothetical protein